MILVGSACVGRTLAGSRARWGDGGGRTAERLFLSLSSGPLPRQSRHKSRRSPSPEMGPRSSSHVRASSTSSVQDVSASSSRAVALVGEPLMGQDKWLGGTLGDDGCVYGVPGSAREVMKVDPVTGEVTLFGGPLPGKFKWLRGVSAGGDIYCIPSNADSILIIHPGPEPTVETVGHIEGDWMYHGGVVAGDGCIYAVPCNATNVLKITPGAVPLLETFGEVPDSRQKWYGGILAPDGCIYCVPNNADKVLKIVPGPEPKLQLFGDLPEGGWKWHGGTLAADGRIYGYPAHAESVLCIDPGPNPTVRTFGGPLDPGSWRPNGKYKYGGGVATPHGPIYAFPSDASRVLKILPIDSPEPQKTQLIGPAYDTAHNKWQNGYFARDGCVYAIPLNAEGVLRIDSHTDDVSTVGHFEGGEKWEGGVEAPDGALYCMPMRAKYVMKIVPGPQGL